MSVLAYTPQRGKRLFEEGIETDSQHDQAPHKRSRCGSSPYIRRARSGSGAWAGGPAGPHPDAFHYLRGLFPGMDDQTLSNVLAECGSDIDAAIRRLNELRLAGDQQATAGNAAAAHEPAGNGDAGAPASLAAPAAQRLAHQQSVPQQPAAAANLQTADEWCEALVGEMAAAKDLHDAKQRAAKALTAFEQFVTQRVHRSSNSGAGEGAGRAAVPAGRVEELQRENAILKRAVQIQNSRMQELASKDAEVAALKQAVAQYQERLRHLEMSNYSLSLHLSRATNGGALQPGQPPPDVF